LKLPRDISSSDLVSLLEKYGYRNMRQTGSHIRLASRIKGKEHHLTIPNHKSIKVGTLSGIITDVAIYLEIDKESFIQALFGTRR
jgi:predicted RNA binding protein YcfA (HicA-like mRNA interferase family)